MGFTETRADNVTARERLIVALDVPTVAEAADLVKKLDNVSFFKIGWELFLAGVMSGDMGQLLELLRQKQVFVDLKVPGDIGNTIGAVINVCVRMNVTFLTLSESMPLATIEAARNTRGHRQRPKLLMVPYLSSLDANDYPHVAGAFAEKGLTLDEYIFARAEAAIGAGCDGLIASGQAISLLRKRYQKSSGIIIVSPGIRPVGTSADDHKRHTTPAEAIRLGADYLVIGRPVRNSSDPRAAAERIIDEIGGALGQNRSGSARGPIEASQSSLCVKPS